MPEATASLIPPLETIYQRLTENARERELLRGLERLALRQRRHTERDRVQRGPRQAVAQ